MFFFLDEGEGLRSLDCFNGALSLELWGFPPGVTDTLRDGLDAASTKIKSNNSNN